MLIHLYYEGIVSSISKKTNDLYISPINKHKNKIILGSILAAILIIGFLFSGGTAPNSGSGSIFTPIPPYKTGLGAINGYVYGPFGLPAVGATVVAAEQGGLAITKTAFISIDGKYVFENLEPGQYIITVAFPDGKNQVLNNVNVEPTSIQTITIKY